MTRTVFAAFALIVLAFAPPVAALDAKAPSGTITIGETTLTILAPEGTTNYQPLFSAAAAKFLQGMVPPSNAQLGWFASTEALLGATSETTLDEVVLGQPRYFTLQLYRPTVEQRVDSATFEAMKPQVKGMIASASKEAVQGAEKDFETQMEALREDNSLNKDQLSASIKLGQPVLVGDIEDTDNMIVFTQILTRHYSEKVEGGGESSSTDMLAYSSIVALVDGLVLYFYTYSKFDSADDIRWVREKGRAWAEAFLTTHGVSTD